ncbi:hypothetical protein [Cerasicoccus frondis]|uniref:hypothetical protein n=1 Tax=Cerasicoccus frondis TaxID=490090 RepID=UPI003CCD35FF
MAGMTFSAEGLNFTIKEGEDSVYVGSGSLKASFETEEIVATVPPNGLEVRDSGGDYEILKLESRIEGDFTLYELDMSAGESGVTFNYREASDDFSIYGEIDLEIDGDSLDALLGNESEPGLLIKNGTVDEVNIGVATDISLGGFTLRSPSSDPLTLQYRAEDDYYSLSGEVSLDSLWQATVSLGTAAQQGIIVENNSWQVEEFEIAIDHLSLGFVSMRELQVSFSRVNNEVDVDIDLDVYIPELGLEVAGKVVEQNGQIHSIFLDFQAEGTTDGFEIPETGVSIVDVNIELQNLNQPSEFFFKGGIGLEFGGQIEIDGVTVTLAYVGGEAYINHNELRLTDAVYFGAYEDSHDDWKSLIFTGNAEINFDWTKEDYSLAGGVSLPTDYGIKISEDLVFNKDEVALMAQAEVRVPDDIKLIGGSDLGSIDAALLIDNLDSSKSFAAGWVDIDLLVHDEEAGIQYTFDDGSFSFISGSEISNIENETTEALDGSDSIKKTYHVTAPEGVKSMVANFRWSYDPDVNDGVWGTSPVPEIVVTATGHVTSKGGEVVEQELSLYQLTYDANAKAFTTSYDDEFSILENTNGVRLSTEGLFFSALSGSVELQAAIAAGEVKLSLEYLRLYDGKIHIEEPHVLFGMGRKDSKIAATVAQAQAAVLAQNTAYLRTHLASTATSFDYNDLITLDIESYSPQEFAEDTVISLHLDTDANGRNGYKIISDIEYTNPDDLDSATSQITWNAYNPTGNVAEEFYLYARLLNGRQSVKYSELIGPYVIRPQVYGTLTDVNTGEPLSGFRIYADANDNLAFDPGIDPTTITRADGGYGISGIPEGTGNISVIVPLGYRVSVGRRSTIALDDLTHSQEIDFELERLNTIQGLVFNDENQNGLYDENENGVQGVTIYFDNNESGAFEREYDSYAITNQNGVWRIYNVNSGPQVLHILAFADQLTNLLATAFEVDFPNSQDGEPQTFLTTEIGILPSAASAIGDTQYMEFAIHYFSGEPSNADPMADPDGDQLSNKLEQLLETDPNVYNSTPLTMEVDGFSGETLHILANLIKTRRYTVLVSDDLVRWDEVDQFRSDSTGPMMLDVDLTSFSKPAFVRLELNER